MNRYFNTITNTRGDSLPGSQARILNSNGTVASIYSDAGGTPISGNLATADGQGVIDFYYVALGDQTLQILDSAGNVAENIFDLSAALDRGNHFGNAPAANIETENFSGSTIPNGSDVQEALQALETAQEAGLAARPTSNDLNSSATGKGAALVRFKILDSAATSRTVSDKLRDVYHIKDFGAVCDGTTDDSAAFQAAIDAIEANGGGRLNLGGSIRVNATVIISGGGVTLAGDNHQSTWIRNGQTNAPAIQFGDGTNNGNRNSIFDVMFGQASGVVSVAGNCGLRIVKQSNFIIANVHMFEFPAQLYDGFVADQSTGTHISNLSVQATKNDGWRLTLCLDTYASNSRSDTSPRGIKFVDCPGVYFNNIACFGNTTYGWDIGSAGVINDSVYHFYTNCIGDTSGSHNWNVTQLSIGVFTACWGSTQLSTAANTSAAGWYFSGGNVSDISMSSPVAISNNGAGIHIDLAARVSITGAVAGSSYKAGAQNGKGGAGSGIRIGQFANRVSVNGGVCENNTSYGIDIDLGADRVNISSVELRDNTAGNLRNNANASVHKAKVSNCGGYNPLGANATTPTVPPSGVGIANNNGVDCIVYITAGTLTNLTVDGAFLFSAGPCTVMVPAGSTITPTYSSLPTWKWMGL